MKPKTEFIYAAIEDAQATIRAIDVKVSVLLVGLLAPFANLGRISAHAAHFFAVSDQLLAYAVIAAFFVAWGLALTALVMAVSAIDNPAAHIASSSNFKGSFYGGGLYRLSVVDSLINRDTVKAEKDFKTFSETYPNTESEIASELTFEHMKLIYIREVKMVRLRFAYRFSIVWFALGLVIYGVSKAS